MLALLSTGKAHYGYEIMDQANHATLTDSQIDAAVVYRTLRELEEAGCVTSQWQPGAGGPHRRMYEVTEVGRQHLQDWLIVLDRHSQRLREFVAQNHLT